MSWIDPLSGKGEEEKSFFNLEIESRKRVFYFFGSITPAVLAIVVLYLLGPDFYLPVAAVFTTYYFALGMGWITSPAVGLHTGMHPVVLTLILIFIAMESSLIVSVNYDLLEKIPLVGKFIKKLRKKAKSVIEKRDLTKDVSYFTIFWLMFIPIYGTGPMVMSVIGRLLGLDWKPLWLTISLSACFRYSLLVVVMSFGLWKL